MFPSHNFCDLYRRAQLIILYQRVIVLAKALAKTYQCQVRRVALAAAFDVPSRLQALISPNEKRARKTERVVHQLF